MMTFKEVCKSLKLKTTKTEAQACCFLEERGYQFLVDFGIKNAVEKATREKSRYIREPAWSLRECVTLQSKVDLDFLKNCGISPVEFSKDGLIK